MYTMMDTIRSALIVEREVALRLALPDEYFLFMNTIGGGTVGA